MQTKVKSGKLTIVDGYITCPLCGKKLQRVPPDMSASNLPVYCFKCKQEFNVNIECGQSLTKTRTVAVESIET